MTARRRHRCRRSALAGVTGLLFGLAGCGGAGDGSSGTDGESGGDGTDAGDGDGDTGENGSDPQDGSTTSGSGRDLDPREANVTGVDLSERADGCRVATTLIHDDESEDGYADWWQVETLDGERIGRRDLAHPHGTRGFTRSTTVSIDAGHVVVRGHDRTHGYGGQAAFVSVPTGDVEFVRQGSEPESFADR